MDGTIIAIDFGLKSSRVAAFVGGRPRVIPNDQGEKDTPSIVAYTAKGELLVGAPAAQQYLYNRENTFSLAKSFLGRMPGETRKKEVDELACRLDLSGSKVYFMCPAVGKVFSPEEITAFILRKLARDASAHLNVDVKKVALSVPICFDHAQRTAIRSAAHIANLDVVCLVNETTSSSAFFSFRNGFKKSRSLVCDLGEGSLDISIVDTSSNTLKVLFASHTPSIRGSDFNKVMAHYLADEVTKQKKLKSPKSYITRLIGTAEKVKKKLSSPLVSSVDVPLVWVSSEGRIELIVVKIKRRDFERRCKDILRRCEAALIDAVRSSELVTGFSSITQVALAGSATRTPALRRLVKRVTRAPLTPRTYAAHSVVLGAAIKAHSLAGEEQKGPSFLELMSVPLGVEMRGGSVQVLVPESCYVPVVVAASFSAFPIQGRVDVHLLQGKEKLAADNRTLGHFFLAGTRETEEGKVEVGIELSIDASGLLSTIEVEELGTENRRQIDVAIAPEPGEDIMHKMVYGNRGYDTFKVISVVRMKDQFLRICGDAVKKNAEKGWDNETSRTCNDLLAETKGLLKRRKWNDASKNFPKLESLLRGESPVRTDCTIPGGDYLTEASEEISPRLSRRCYNLLRGHGISTLGDLVGCSEADLMRIKRFGPKALEETTRWLRKEHSIVLPGS